MKNRKIPVGALTLLLAVLLTLSFSVPAGAQGGCGSDVEYRVRLGDTLNSIARAFGTTSSAIARANGISNRNLIYAGEVLSIPCAGGSSGGSNGSGTGTDGDANLPGGRLLPGVEFPTIVLDCSPLRISSPRQGLAHGMNTVYFDPVAGATSYRVNVYGVDENTGQLLASYDSNGALSRARGDFSLDAIGPGFEFALEAEALVSGIPVCRTGRLEMFREAVDFGVGVDTDDEPEPTPTPDPVIIIIPAP